MIIDITSLYYNHLYVYRTISATFKFTKLTKTLVTIKTFWEYGVESYKLQTGIHSNFKLSIEFKYI